MHSSGGSDTKVSIEYISTESTRREIKRTYPLCMKVCRLCMGTNEVAPNSRLINAIKLPLKFEEIGLTK